MLDWFKENFVDTGQWIIGDKAQENIFGKLSHISIINFCGHVVLAVGNLLGTVDQ